MRDTIEMAREAGAIHIYKQPKEFAIVGNEAIESFEALVRADERDACAKVCEEYETNNDITATWLNIVADAIRARGAHEAR
jgi:hypothetical protein